MFLNIQYYYNIIYYETVLIIEKRKEMYRLVNYYNELVQGVMECKEEARKLLLPFTSFTSCVENIAPNLLGRHIDFKDKKAFILAHDDIDNVIDPYIIEICKHFKTNGYIIIISTSGVPQNIDLTLKYDWVDTFVQHNGKGDKFSAWRAALYILPSIYQSAELILTNDSLFGPIGKFSTISETMNDIPCDFWGLTENHNIFPHLETDFLVFRPATIQHVAFKNFFLHISEEEDKNFTLKYDTIFTMWLAYHGLQPGVYFPYNFDMDFFKDRWDEILQNDLIGNSNFSNKYFTPRCIANSAMIDQWELLLDSGVIFLSKKLLFNNIYEINVSKCLSKIKSKGYNTNLIFNHAVRLGLDLSPLLCSENNEVRSYKWPNDVLTLQQSINLPAKGDNECTKINIAAFIHIYYTEFISELFEYINNLPSTCSLYLTTDTEQKRELLQEYCNLLKFKQIKIYVFPNSGFDIAPFIVGLSDEIKKYDLIVKVHAKRSLHITEWSAREWCLNLLQTLLGSPSRVRNIIALFQNEEKLGMLSAMPCTDYLDSIGKSINLDKMNLLLSKYDIELREDTAIDFPMGSMFWCRPTVLLPWLDLKLSFDDFGESELGQNDGTLAHAIERIFFFGCGITNHTWGRISASIDTMAPIDVKKIELPYYEPKASFNSFQVDVKAIAFYLPQFHTFPENDTWWGEGFTEWVNVRRAYPQFLGHVQPLSPHPSIGYYDLSNSDVLKQQALLAKQYGIYGFCFHHYWFCGKRLMTMPIKTLLEDSSIDIPFCLNWANENWTRRWDGLESEILIKQEYSAEDDNAFMQDVLQYFRDPRYIRVNGRPLFLVYRVDIIPNMEETLCRWRKICTKNGEAEPYFVMVQSFTNIDPIQYGFDAAVQFPPHSPYPFRQCSDPHVFGKNLNFVGSIKSYEQVMFEMQKFLLFPKNYKLFPCVIPAWDNTPRKLNRSLIYAGSTPEKYESWLKLVSKYVKQTYTNDEQLLFVNAWNEWAEGAILEPSESYGFAYLNATLRGIMNQ